MRIFPLDIVTGTLLLLSIIQMLAGILVYRYRRGKGPLILAISGSFIVSSSLIWILNAVELIAISWIIPGVILIIGIIAFILSLFLWREKG